jgi:ABC-type spermidine/putrescine transport system permease subunit II
VSLVSSGFTLLCFAVAIRAMISRLQGVPPMFLDAAQP